jgi:hypothetical protein
MPRKVKKRRKRKSKSMGNRRFRNKKLTIKVKRKFPKKRTRKRRLKKQRGGGPFDFLPNLFGKKKTPDNAAAAVNEQRNPLANVDVNTQEGKQALGFLTQIQKTANKAIDGVKGAANTAVSTTQNIAKQATEFAGQKTAKTLTAPMESVKKELDKVLSDIQKIMKPFENFDGKICPCCNQPLNNTNESVNTQVAQPLANVQQTQQTTQLTQ